MSFALSSYALSHYLVGRKGAGSFPIFIDKVKPNSQHVFFAADWPCGQKWLIKQPFFLHRNESFTIVNEALVTKIIYNIDTVSAYVPAFIDYNPVHTILITERLAEYKSISQDKVILKPSVLLAGNLLEEAGKMLGTLHLRITEAVKKTKDQHLINNFKPSFLTDNVSFLNPLIQNEDIPQIRRDWLKNLFFENRVSAIFDSLSREWKSDSIIHGDATFDNILVRSVDTNQYLLKLCDWEFAGFGDLDWDLANFVQGLISLYMEMCINRSLFREAVFRLYSAYKSANHSIDLPPFSEWLPRIIKLATVSLLIRLFNDSMIKIAGSQDSNLGDNRIEDILPSSNIVEFLLIRVLLNSHLLE